MKRFVINGGDLAGLEDLYDQVGLTLCPGFCWGRNLDAFNDILRGGFGAFEYGERIEIEWVDSARSRESLGYGETVRQLTLRLQRCHPSNRTSVQEQLDQAKRGAGPTVFEWLMEIIGEHRNVTLILR